MAYSYLENRIYELERLLGDIVGCFDDTSGHYETEGPHGDIFTIGPALEELIDKAQEVLYDEYDDGDLDDGC